LSGQKAKASEQMASAVLASTLGLYCTTLSSHEKHSLRMSQAVNLLSISTYSQ